MKLKCSHWLTCLAVVALVLASGCAKPKPAGLSDAQLLSTAETILKAVDANDYEAFSAQVSDPMKAAFTQEQFSKLHSMLATASGKYISVEAPALTNNQGYAIYRFPAKYERETVYVTLTFLTGGDKVEGFFMDSPNLREVPK
jgi:hypothetical protein